MSSRTYDTRRIETTQGNDVVISVRLHKTGHVAPAYVSHTYGLRKVFQYVKYVRSKLVGVGFGDSDPVFISWGSLRL